MMQKMNKTVNTMKQQRMALPESMFSSLIFDATMSTIRWNESFIKPGELVLYSEEKPHIETRVQVTRVTQMPLTQVARFLGKVEEWDEAWLLMDMQRYYPQICSGDNVQVIEFFMLEECRDAG